MAAKAYLAKGIEHWYIRIDFRGKSGVMPSYKHVKMSEALAEELAMVISDIILKHPNDFEWSDWVPSMGRQFRLKAVVREFLEDKSRLRPATLGNYRHAIDKHILPNLGNPDVRKLTKSDFAWIKQMNTQTAKLVRDTMQNILNWAYHEYSDEWDRNKLELDPVQLPKRRVDYLEYHDQLAVLSKVPPHYYGPCLLSVEMALRVGEICVLRWTNIEEDGIKITHSLSKNRIVEYPKEGEPKWLPMPEVVKDYLTTLVRGFGYVFPGKLSGEHLWPYQIYGYWKKAAREAGFPNSRLHQNRNSFAMRMLQEGLPIHSVSLLMGHHDSHITERVYARHDKRAMKRLLEFPKSSQKREACEANAT